MQFCNSCYGCLGEPSQVLFVELIRSPRLTQIFIPPFSLFQKPQISKNLPFLTLKSPSFFIKLVAHSKPKSPSHSHPLLTQSVLTQSMNNRCSESLNRSKRCSNGTQLTQSKLNLRIFSLTHSNGNQTGRH